MAAAWWHSRLNILSGILALVSGGSIVAALSKLVHDQTALQVISIVLSIASGVMSLFLTKLFDQKAISEMYDLAGTFADIRERATIEKIRPANTEEKKFDKLVKLKADYVKATAKSDKYLGSDELVPSPPRGKFVPIERPSLQKSPVEDVDKQDNPVKGVDEQ